MDRKQIIEDIQRGWKAPILLVFLSTMMALPATALVCFVIFFVVGLSYETMLAFGAAVQILLTYWIAGLRLRRSGR